MVFINELFAVKYILAQYTVTFPAQHPQPYNLHQLIFFTLLSDSCACIQIFWITIFNDVLEDTDCSARDWDRIRIRITWGNPQSGCSDICSYSKRATVCVRATYATRRNSGMKRVKCG